MLFISACMPAFCNYIEFEQSKYIAIIFFGYVCYIGWGIRKPDKLFASFWPYCQPFLFSTIGASIKFGNINTEIIGNVVLIILIGLTFRWIATYLVTGVNKNYLSKERAFIAFSWMPKATVQAAIGGIVLD